MYDHADLAQQAFDASHMPPPLRNVADALRYLQTLLSLLPPDEKAGYVKSKPGAENTMALPDGQLVRVSRLMYESGWMVKVMNDSPNGNPQWADEGQDDPNLFYPYSGTHSAPPVVVTPPSTSGLEARVALLEQARLGEIGALNEQLKNLDARVQKVEGLEARVVALEQLADQVRALIPRVTAFLGTQGTTVPVIPPVVTRPSWWPF